MATLDEIGRERQRVSEQLARLDVERAKLANELNELEITERTSSRLPAFSLCLPGSCPNNRDRRSDEFEAGYGTRSRAPTVRS
jgi:hypothetical protein